MTEYDWMGEEWDKQMWEEYEIRTFGKKMSMNEKLMSLPKEIQEYFLTTKYHYYNRRNTL